MIILDAEEKGGIVKEKQRSLITGWQVQLIFAKNILIKSCAACETNTVSPLWLLLAR